MAEASYANELLEVTSEELGTVVRDDARLDFGEFLQGTLEDDLNILLSHGTADLVMDNRARTAIQNRAEVVESSADIEIADVGVPVFVRLKRLNESGPFFRGLPIPSLQEPGFL